MTISDEVQLVRWFHKPDSNTYTSFFTAANFLTYGNNLKLVRVAGSSAKNASDGTSTLLIKNQDIYETDYLDLSAAPSVGNFSARYAGDLGNSIKVSLWASSSSAAYDNWQYAAEFPGVPGTSTWATANGGVNDELHIIVIDVGGKITGVPGTVLEKFAYLSKASDAKNDDGSSNYYVNVINDRSEFIYVMHHLSTANANVASVSIVSGGRGHSNGNLSFASADGASLDALAYANVDTNGVVTSVTILNKGTTFVLGDDITATMSVGASAGNSNAVFSVTLAAAPYSAYTDATTGTWGSLASGVNFSQNVNSITATLTGGVTAAPSDGDLNLGYDIFKDSESIDVSLIMTGAHSTTVSNHVIGTVVDAQSGRRDCVVFVSPQMSDVVNDAGNEADNIVATRNDLTSSSYVVMDSNWKKQFDKYNNVYRWVPLNGDIAGLCVATDYNRDPWFSPAGLNRGVIKNVTKLAWNPTKADRDTLYSNSVNPVVTFKGDGTVLYGDKTMTAKPSAFDRINVRRLFIVLEKAISKAAKYSLFEFNDEFTRSQFVAIVEPYLRNVKGRRGIYDYKVVCNTTNNTPEVIDRNEFVGDIYIKPARSINFIQLNFVAVRSGVAFSEIIGKF